MAIMVSVPSPYSCVRCGTYSCMALNVTNLVCCFDGKDGQMTEACYEYPSSNAIFHFPPFSFCFCWFPPSSSACVIMNQCWSNGMRVVFTTFNHRVYDWWWMVMQLLFFIIIIGTGLHMVHAPYSPHRVLIDAWTAKYRPNVSAGGPNKFRFAKSSHWSVAISPLYTYRVSFMYTDSVYIITFGCRTHI